MDNSFASVAPITDEVDGQSVEFPRLSARLDLPKLGEQIRVERRAAAMELAKEKKFDMIDVYKVVLDIKWTPVKTRDIFFWVQSPEGANFALVYSLKKAGKTEEDAQALVDKIHPIGQVGLAAMVVGAISPQPQEQPDPLPKSS